MTARLKLSPDLALPIECVTEKLGFLGRTGSGKSYAAQKLAEEFHAAGAQFVALDPVGNWYGLRLAADGKSPGIPIPVFGGLQGDVPLEPTAGALIADVVVDRGISAVIDVSQFESDAEKARFARDFATRLFYRKKAAPSAMHLFLEEAQEFIPQNPMSDEAQMLHAFQRMWKLGRNFGVGGSVISQRPQELNKKVLNQTELLFAFQLTGPQERKTMQGWIAEKGLGEDIAGELPKLKQGQPHVWSPAWLQVSKVIRIGQKWTLDASSTPKVGARANERSLAPIDIEQLGDAIKASRAKAEAADPKALNQRIRALERQLVAAEKGKGVIAAAEVEERIQAAREDAAQREWARHDRVTKVIVRGVERAIAELQGIAQAVEEQGIRAPKEMKAARPAPAEREYPRTPERLTTPSRMAPARKVTQSNGDQPDASIGKTPQRMLDALAFYQSIGQDFVRREMLAGYVGISANSGTFRNYLSQLRTPGLIEDHPDGRVALTAAGQSAAGTAGAPPRLADLHAHWRSKLGGTPGRMLDVLIEAHPDPVSRAGLAEAVGIDHSSGTFRNYLSQLRTPGVIEDVSKEAVVASDLLFPPGLS